MTPPVETLSQLAGGMAGTSLLACRDESWRRRCAPRGASDGRHIGRRTGVDAGALARVLRLLASYGVFEYREGLFSHSAASLTLRADHPQSMRPLVQMLGLDPFWTAIGAIEYSLRTGRRATDNVLPGGVWGYLAGNVEASRFSTRR